MRLVVEAARHIEHLADEAVHRLDLLIQAVDQPGVGLQAQQVGRDILRRMAGSPLPASSDAVTLPAGLCWASVTHDEAIMVSIGATMVPGEAPKLASQVDLAHNRVSRQGAVEWGPTVWNNMLG